MRAAITLRRRDIVTVVPRSAEATIGVLVLDGTDGAGVPVITGAGAAGLMTARMSSLRIRPPMPEPVTMARSTPCSFANWRTIGVTYESSRGVATASGAATTGATTTGATITGAATTGAATGTTIGAG